MDYFQSGDNIVLTGYDSFEINEILECGQCFRFNKLGEKEYTVIAFGKVLNIRHEAGKIIFSPCTTEEFETVWTDYFDLKRDYSEIKSKLYESDEHMRSAIDFGGGIRILNQDIWECLISFIISQNQNIPRIKQVIKNLSELFGHEIRDSYYSFPDPHTLSSLTIDELNTCRAGFRTKYILDAAKRVDSGRLNIDSFSALTTEELKAELTSVYGVGTKVADCVMLFSCRRSEIFPTDVWVKRVMQYYYFDNKDVNIKEIHALAQDKWGDLAGYAQQYLFHHARALKIGTK